MPRAQQDTRTARAFLCGRLEGIADALEIVHAWRERIPLIGGRHFPFVLGGYAPLVLVRISEDLDLFRKALVESETCSFAPAHLPEQVGIRHVRPSDPDVGKFIHQGWAAEPFLRGRQKGLTEVISMVDAHLQRTSSYFSLGLFALSSLQSRLIQYHDEEMPEGFASFDADWWDGEYPYEPVT